MHGHILNSGFWKSAEDRWRSMSCPTFLISGTMSGEMKAIWRAASCLWSLHRLMQRRQWRFTGAGPQGVLNVAVLDTEASKPLRLYLKMPCQGWRCREVTFGPSICCWEGQCRGIEELRKNRTGITPDCMLTAITACSISIGSLYEMAYIGKGEA